MNKTTHEFSPSLKFVFPEKYFNNNFDKDLLDSLIFNLGIVESISYWKAACCKDYFIDCGYLNQIQIKWWKELFYYGLGEFRYCNNIKTSLEDFINITTDKKTKNEKTYDTIKFDSRAIVPIGGGKDSIVSIELLKSKLPVIPYLINPNKSMLDTIRIAGFDSNNCIIVDRKIHPKLLELNAQGYLNGHTPFSAMVAFTTLIASLMTSSKYIALSNEASANESTVNIGNDDIINHQYSKTIHFESAFRNYYSKYLSENFNYFSYLRNLQELQIAQRFALLKEYHKHFRSCNVGSKEDRWCGNCPKCLFVYIMLLPFLCKDELIDIFGNDLLLNDNLQETLFQLTGFSETKPFECVGTISETRAALAKYLSENEAIGILIPYLKQINLESDLKIFDEIINSDNDKNFIPKELSCKN
ncbi:hypothetical protein LJC30_01205 [Odoribacter sp. OttesenSCG-928-L07]|nr:hypothetical protein [Odoribacter sp. OttesenSCG-928-L07]MDL2240454.1 hypothetical protein [Bacteroidales bacterium OttesenSCG-928-K22]